MFFNATRDSVAETPPVWVIFGDLMAGLFGIFVLFFVWAVAYQVDLRKDLDVERVVRTEQARRISDLEAALAGPLSQGRISLDRGKIGISGSMLFDLNSADLRPGGDELLRELSAPLQQFLAGGTDLVMVSGFTDDLPIHGAGRRFQDNWQLSSERALTVTRALVRAGVPRGRLFSAGFGEAHPTVPNHDDTTRAQNRRVEIAPVPRQKDKTP